MIFSHIEIYIKQILHIHSSPILQCKYSLDIEHLKDSTKIQRAKDWKVSIFLSEYFK